MKLKTNTQPLETNLNNKKQFSIAVTSKSFEILSSNIYSDPIKAIIRELSTNAYDAHISAGNKDVPFEVHIPDSLSNLFRIRDFGTGLTQEQIEQNYTQYFFSSRKDSNDYVGCLGLGSKTPFSYTDQFSVISYIGGTRYTYIAFLDENRCPSLSFVESQETSEPNGLQIQFSIKNIDFYHFKSTANEVYRHFNPKPKININLSNDEPIWQTDNFKVFGAYNYNNHITVVMGNIAYENIKVDGAKLNCELTVPIGSIDITANREDVQYTEKTKKTLSKLYNKYSKIFFDNIIKDVQLKTLGEAVSISKQFSLTFDYQNLCKIVSGKIYSIDEKYGSYHYDVTYKYVPSHYTEYIPNSIKDEKEYEFIQSVGISIKRWGWTTVTKLNTKSKWVKTTKIESGYYIIKNGSGYSILNNEYVSPRHCINRINELFNLFGKVNLYCIKTKDKIPDKIKPYSDYLKEQLQKLDLDAIASKLSESTNDLNYRYFDNKNIPKTSEFYKWLTTPNNDIDITKNKSILHLADSLGIAYTKKERNTNSFYTRYPILKHISPYHTDCITEYVKFIDFLYEKYPQIMVEYGQS